MKESNLYLLNEGATVEPNVRLIGVDSKFAKIRTVLQDCHWNRNRRLYSKAVLDNCLNRENIREMLMYGRWFGEAGHPVKPTRERQMDVNKLNSSHRVLAWEWVGDKIEGIVKTNTTPVGNLMRDVILDTEDPCRVAFSFRSIGPVKVTSDGYVVKDPLIGVAYDWVDFPSHSCANQKEVLTKLAESVNSNYVLCESGLVLPKDDYERIYGDNNSESMMLNESLEYSFTKDAMDFSKLSESVMIPVFADGAAEAKNYVLEENKDVIELITNLNEMANITSTLSDDRTTLFLEDARCPDGSKKTVIMSLDDAIKREIRTFKWR